MFEATKRRIFQVVSYPKDARGGMETHAGVFAHDFPRASERWSVTSIDAEALSGFRREDLPPPDCLLVESWNWTDLVPRARSVWPGVPIVARTGGNDFHYAIAYEKRRRTDEWYRAWLEDMRDSVDLVIATSAFSARRLRESDLGFLPVAAVRGGAFVVSGCRRDPAQRPRIVVVGRLVELKGPDDCIDVVAAVQRTRDAELVFVGEGPEREALEAAAAETLRPGSYAFPGAVPPSEAMALIADADLLLSMPRPVHERIGESRVLHIEAMGRAVCEAVCNGIPVVASRVGGLPEMVAPEAGTLVPERDTGAAAAAVAEWLERGRPAGAAVAAARERFGWPAIFEQYESLFGAVCARRLPGLR